MRQTDFTLDQILDLLLNEGKTSGFPKCMLVNEVGVIFREQKDEASENALLTLLENKHPECRAISFCYLSTDEDTEKKHQVLLAEFRLKPENQMFLVEIDEKIYRFKKRAIHQSDCEKLGLPVDGTSAQEVEMAKEERRLSRQG